MGALMKITIDADIFSRMSHAAGSPSDPVRPHLACVRLEYRGGYAYAVASNSFIMAIYYLGPTTEPDEFMNVSYTAPSGDDTLEIEGWQAASFGMINGHSVTLLPEKEPLFTEWWKIVPDPARFERGFIYLQDELFHKLAMSSPSGHIVFPAVVDALNYMYVRDVHDPNWLGLLHARYSDKKLEAATIPEWIPR